MQSGFHTWLNHQFFLWLALSLFGLNSRTCDDFIDAIAFHVFYTPPRFIIFYLWAILTEKIWMFFSKFKLKRDWQLLYI
jgi:hypothetical protein